MLPKNEHMKEHKISTMEASISWGCCKTIGWLNEVSMEAQHAYPSFLYICIEIKSWPVTLIRFVTYYLPYISWQKYWVGQRSTFVCFQFILVKLKVVNHRCILVSQQYDRMRLMRALKVKCKTKDHDKYLRINFSMLRSESLVSGGPGRHMWGW